MNARFDLADFFFDKKSYDEGAHAYYARLTPDLGIKVGKPGAEIASIQRIVREFIILKGVEPSGLTPEAYCCGTVALINPASNRRISLPYILMQHLEGPSGEDVLDLFINEFYAMSPEYNPKANQYERQNWAFEHAAFIEHRRQYERILAILNGSYQLEMCDHRTNFRNFIINQGLWKAIDFSCENIPKATRRAMRYRAEPYLKATLPPVHLLADLRRAGFIYYD